MTTAVSKKAEDEREEGSGLYPVCWRRNLCHTAGMRPRAGPKCTPANRQRQPRSDFHQHHDVPHNSCRKISWTTDTAGRAALTLQKSTSR